MTRKRMIHPDFFVSATMNDLPVSAMLTFAGIWCWADDYGRGEDDEALVKAAVWPRRRSMTEKKVRSDIDALTSHDVICKYIVAGHYLIHVTNWGEHQKVQHPTPSKLPPCQAHDPEAWDQFMNGTDPATEKFRSDSRAAHEKIWRAS